MSMDFVRSVFDGVPVSNDTKYDFYANLPKTYDQVREYLVTWLHRLDTPHPVTVDGRQHYQVAGFRRALTIHGVSVDPERKQVVFTLSSDDGDRDCLPFTDYQSSYEAVIDAAARRYCAMWNILAI